MRRCVWPVIRGRQRSKSGIICKVWIFLSSYENLANAIILQAVKDYKRALHRLDVNPKNRDAMHEKERLERFFHSPWYEMLTDLDADRLIEGVQEWVRQEAAKRRKKKATGKASG